MAPQDQRSRIPPEVFQYSGLGCAFAGGVLLFTGIGWFLDGKLGAFPVFTMVGALAGMAISSLSVWQTLQKGLKEMESPADNEDKG
jgi:F0F1-type ATP synthase assembly protein I